MRRRGSFKKRGRNRRSYARRIKKYGVDRGGIRL